MGSTDPDGLAPVVIAAARGEMPAWARVRPERREHIGRVAALLREWAEALDLPEKDRVRWTAAGTLHDALRDADEEELRSILGSSFADLQPALLHGPAAALRLSAEADDELLRAVRYHTIGHPDLDRLGRALYLADFLEPGRDFANEWRESLRERMPHDQSEVLVEVLGARIQHLISRRHPIRCETAAFWSSVTEGA